MKKKYIELEATESGDEEKHSINSTEDENDDQLVFDEEKIKELLGLDTELLSCNDNHERILRIDLFKDNSDLIKSNEKNNQNKRKHDKIFKSNSQGKKVTKDNDQYKIKIDFSLADKSISQTFPTITRLDLLTKKPSFYLPDETNDNELLEMMEEKKMRDLTLNCTELKKSFIKRVTQNNEYIKQTIVNLNDEDYLLSKKKISTKGCNFKLAYKSNGKCKLIPDKKSIENRKPKLENENRKINEQINYNNKDKINLNNNKEVCSIFNSNFVENKGISINNLKESNTLKRNNSQIITKSFKSNEIFEDKPNNTNNNHQNIGAVKTETNSFSQLIKSVSNNSQSISYISSQNRIVKKSNNLGNSLLNNINQGKLLPKIKDDTRQINNISSLFYITERNRINKDEGSKRSLLKSTNIAKRDEI